MCETALTYVLNLCKHISKALIKCVYGLYVKITTLSEDIAILSKHLTKIVCAWFALFQNISCIHCRC